MIIIHHDLQNAKEVWHNTELVSKINRPILTSIIELSKTYPSETLVWCHEDFINFLNYDYILSLEFFQSFMVSFNPGKKNYIPNEIGLVDQSVFVNVNKAVVYPTWLMSSFVGAIKASSLNNLNTYDFEDNDFNYFLNSFAKHNMPKGLFCYSSPLLFKSKIKLKADFSKMSSFSLYKFVKENYRLRWVLLLFLQQIIYFRKIQLIAFLNAFFSKPNLKFPEYQSNQISIDDETNVLNESIDVIIPTLARKLYLSLFLNDLRSQSLIPKNVIIVEQLEEDKTSELEFLYRENWPFNIIHLQTNQIGACNARNLALKEIKSSWLFFADDDIKIDSDFLEKALKKMKNLSIKAGQFFTYMTGETSPFNAEHFQWNAFGTCSSIVSSDIINLGCRFDMSYEFGYGEDSDFGMQIRNKGFDIIHFNEPKIFHYKAPNGGFRTPSMKPWERSNIKPLPSPTVTIFNKKYLSNEQMLSYKTTLIFKFILSNSIYSNFKFLYSFSSRWNSSLNWANTLSHQR